VATLRLEIPPKLIPVFAAQDMRYRGAYGGRGSAKTRTFAKMAAVRGLMASQEGKKGVILCGREFMNSLDDSSMSEIKAAIASEPWLSAHYDVGEKYIRTWNKRVAFKFCGLRHNLDSVKSKARILLAWIDEAEQVSDAAWRKLIPTVREADSEIWVTWNPESPGSPVDVRFRGNHDADMIVVEMNYLDNPWFPAVLEAERQRDQRNLDPDIYAHIWEGAYLSISDAQVLRGKFRIDEFTPGTDWDGPYFGADWGFSTDPTALVKMWIHGNRLYMEHDVCEVGIEVDDTPAFFAGDCPRKLYGPDDTPKWKNPHKHRGVPGAVEHTIRADSARPETISYMRRHGFNIVGASKGEGSVVDGVAHLRSYDHIIIHPRCKATAREARLWSYKRDRLTGDVLPVLADGNDHCFDAARYGLEPIIKAGAGSRSSIATTGTRIFGR
jgi:phage terminase large subunit